MKLLLLTISLVLTSSIVASITRGEECKLNSDEVNSESEQLKKAYQKLSIAPYSITYQQQYFEAFPCTFYSFNQLFGYSDKEPLGEPVTDFSPLYNESHLYVTAFFKLTGISKTQYYNRMIDISINGKWYADGVSDFQHGMQEKLKSDTDIFLELLSKRSEKEIKSFWYFFFDGPHPDHNIPKEFDNMKMISPKIYSIMVVAHNEVLKNVDH